MLHKILCEGVRGDPKNCEEQNDQINQVGFFFFFFKFYFKEQFKIEEMVTNIGNSKKI